MKIFPSLISADILDLKNVIHALNDHCDGYHIDVMDDHFVPNLTWGPAFVKAIMKETNLPIHLHLMVDNPEKWIDRIALREDDIFIFHVEALKNIDVIDFLKKINGCKKGIALNPETAVKNIFDVLEALDHVLIMSVNPGFSGQKFIPDVVEKVKTLKKMREEKSLQFTIGIDGGINSENIKMVVDAGADEVGAASAIFSRGGTPDDFVGAIKLLRERSK